MLKKILFIISLIILCTACSIFNKYEGYMDKARDSIRSGEYQKSIDYINNALIEEPTSKDAIALKEMAMNSLQAENEKKESELFLSQTEGIFQSLKVLTAGINEDASNISISEAKNLKDKLSPLHSELERLSPIWSVSEKHSNAFTNLFNASTELNDCFIAIIEDVQEPIDYNGDYSRSNVFKKNIASNDSAMRAKLSFGRYLTYIDSYK